MKTDFCVALVRLPPAILVLPAIEFNSTRVSPAVEVRLFMVALSVPVVRSRAVLATFMEKSLMLQVPKLLPFTEPLVITLKPRSVFPEPRLIVLFKLTKVPLPELVAGKDALWGGNV